MYTGRTGLPYPENNPLISFSFHLLVNAGLSLGLGNQQCSMTRISSCGQSSSRISLGLGRPPFNTWCTIRSPGTPAPERGSLLNSCTFDSNLQKFHIQIMNEPPILSLLRYLTKIWRCLRQQLPGKDRETINVGLGTAYVMNVGQALRRDVRHC